ncbi:MAG: hypothetical protein MJE77_21430 [Proteobacteria bacterium]|nr:hypothetical protein [Pseudomonadota bacterium]
MDDEDARLQRIGIPIITDARDSLVRAECIRIARRMHLSGNKVFGFIPAADDIAVPPVMIQLGIALTEITGSTIAVVDANVRWPGLAGLAEGHEPDSDDSVFKTNWVRGSLALLSPPRSERAGEAVPQLARLLLEGCDLFANVLVDLTGFDLLGEHASAAACMDSVILLARTRKTRERHLLMMRDAMPKNRFMGVLLVG